MMPLRFSENSGGLKDLVERGVSNLQRRGAGPRPCPCHRSGDVLLASPRICMNLRQQSLVTSELHLALFWLQLPEEWLVGRCFANGFFEWEGGIGTQMHASP